MTEIKCMCVVLKRNDYCSNSDLKLLLISDKDNLVCIKVKYQLHWSMREVPSILSHLITALWCAVKTIAYYAWNYAGLLASSLLITSQCNSFSWLAYKRW